MCRCPGESVTGPALESHTSQDPFPTASHHSFHVTEENVREADQTADQNAEQVAGKEQHWRAARRAAPRRGAWSQTVRWDPLQMFQSRGGLHRKAAVFGGGTRFLCPV